MAGIAAIQSKALVLYDWGADSRDSVASVDLLSLISPQKAENNEDS